MNYPQTQDSADSEFAVVKTALNNHLIRADSSASDYCEIDTSEQVVTFGKNHLGQPRPNSGIKERIFFDLPPATIQRRKELDKEDPLDSKTLSGIASVFEIICEVFHNWMENIGKYWKIHLVCLIFQASGRVLWRRFPCFCTSCMENQWDLCQEKATVGKVKTVKLD